MIMKEHIRGLTSEEQQRFATTGYLVLPGFFSPGMSSAMVKALTRLRLSRPDSKALIPDSCFDGIIVDPDVLGVVKCILGPTFLFHHANGRELVDDQMGKAWHHDYDGLRMWTPGVPMMIHLMIYPAGLAPNGGPLVVLPHSHHRPVAREYPTRFGVSTLKDEVEIYGGPGLMVALNSAVWHARRPAANGHVRYYLNASYCQPGEMRPERDKYAHLLEYLRGTLSREHRCLCDDSRTCRKYDLCTTPIGT